MSYEPLAIKKRNKIQVESDKGYSIRKTEAVCGFRHPAVARERNGKTAPSMEWSLPYLYMIE